MKGYVGQNCIIFLYQESELKTNRRMMRDGKINAPVKHYRERSFKVSGGK